MTRLKSMATIVLALNTLAASTSIAPAAGGSGVFGAIQVPVVPVVNVAPGGSGNSGNNGGSSVPINPGIINLPVPVKPHLPIKPGVISLGTPEAPSRPAMLIDCEVKDVASTTDDFWIVNVGEASLPNGLKVHYRVPSTGDRGAFFLPRDILPGAKLKIAGLLDGAESGADCRVRIL